MNILSFAQVDPPPPPNPFQIVKEAGEGGSTDDCNYIKNLTVYVSNLDLYGITESNGVYTITNEVPPLYIQLIINNAPIGTLFPVSDFVHAGYYDTDIIGDNQVGPLSLFSSEIIFGDGIFPTCEVSEYNLEIRFITPLNPNDPSLPIPHMPIGYKYYPVFDHASTNGLFSCNIFEFTECVCNNSCSSVIPSFSSINKCDCGRPDDNGNGFDFYQSSNEGNYQTKSTATLSTSPNPFKDSFTLYYPAESNDEINISIYNINGQKIINSKELVAKGSNTISVGASELSTGIYFVQVVDSNQNTSFLKIIKE